MTRVRVGLDLASATAVATSLDRFGDRFTRVLFTDGELRDADGEPQVRAQRLAARFAAKEAAIKMLAPTGEVPCWRELEVRTQTGGSLALVLHGRAAALAAEAGVQDVAVSISHDGSTAAAVVVALCADGKGN